MYGFGFNGILFSCTICWAFIVINDRMIATVSAAATAKPSKAKVRSCEGRQHSFVVYDPWLTDWRWMVFVCAQKIIFQKIEHDVNNDIMKMDVMMKNRTNGSPTVDVDAVLFRNLDEPIFVSSWWPRTPNIAILSFIWIFTFFFCIFRCGAGWWAVV